MTAEPFSVDADGFRIGGRIAAGPAARGPLVVCLHGGSYTSAYFDLPGHSLLELSAAAGLPVLALDRPCYGESDELEGETSFAANGEILERAIGKAWGSIGEGRSGVVLIGHSMGGAIALDIASRKPSWPLFGVAISGIGQVAPPPVVETMQSLPPDAPVDFPIEMRRQFMYGPDGTFDPGVLEAAEISTAPMPVAEAKEVVGGWIDRFPQIAAAIEVPVHYVMAQHEGLWVVDEATVSEFAGHFTAAPSVESSIFRGAGHNIDHHLLGEAFQLEQLAFALRSARTDGRGRPS